MGEPDNTKDNTKIVAPLSIGSMVLHYKLLERIGSGGMGEVYLAEDTTLNRRVALKFLAQQYVSDSDCVARFKREAKAAAALSHPNIVTVHEVNEYQGRPFFAMEHVQGMSLSDYVATKEPSIGRIVDLAIQMCEGLSKAHQLGIVHRDIKTANVLVDGDGRPKILDFGLASVRGAEKLTKVGSTLGTVPYMSPEQAHGQEVDQRSDLFSLGVVLYEMIAGKTPFRRDSDAATLKAITEDAVEPLARYRANVPEDLQRIISKLLEKDPALRYQTASGVISDLKKLAISGQTGTITPIKRRSSALTFILGAVALAAVAILVIVLLVPKQKGAEIGSSKMLVVLPFENLGGSEQAYFADGITDEITSRLAGIEGIGVISRTSALQYKSTTKPLKEIGKELGVSYVLEGTIRWDRSGDTSRVRITPQLIRVADDRHVWSEIYERPLTQVFAVQSDIAGQIVKALDVTLGEGEQKSIESKPTEDLAAYDFYLRGKDYIDKAQSLKEYKLGLQMLEKAVVLDPKFYKAYALLARYYSNEFFSKVSGKERLQQAKEAAEKAFKYADGKPEGYLAMGYYYYYGDRDYDKALGQFDIALKGQPNNVELINAIAYVQRRKGEWNESLSNMLKATQLDPRSFSPASEAAETAMLMRRYDEAEEIVDRALALAPDNVGCYVMKSWISFARYGDLAKFKEILDKASQLVDKDRLASQWESYYWMSHDCQTALTQAKSVGDALFRDSVDYYSSKAEFYECLGDKVNCRIYNDSALAVTQDRLRQHPDAAKFHMDLAYAFAGLGRKKEAIKEAKKAVELMPISEDALYGMEILGSLAGVYVKVNEPELAIDQIEYLLTIPSYYNINDLRIHPSWDPLRSNPRFKKLIGEPAS